MLRQTPHWQLVGNGVHLRERVLFPNCPLQQQLRAFQTALSGTAYTTPSDLSMQIGHFQVILYSQTDQL
jgi:hypothetical protein